MSGDDAFEGEMDFLRQLKPEDEGRVIAGTAPAEGELGELAGFTQALRSTLSAQPVPAGSPAFVALLADTARASLTTAQDASRTTRLRSRGARTRPRRRLALVARVAVAVATVPFLFAGLAFAGVTLPAPADSAFESLGLELPNQATDDDDTEGTAKDGDSAGSATGQENSAGKLGHGKAKGNKARNHGKQGRGRALGKRGVAPAQTNTQGNAVGKTPPGQASEPPGKATRGSGQARGGGKARGGGRAK